MSGAHRLAAAELTKNAKDLKGDAYLNAVEAEMTGEHVVNEGTEKDNKETSDKI